MFVKLLVTAGLALLFWTIVVHPSGARGEKTVYRVQAHDTLWTIATSHYAGDVRKAVWEIQHANNLDGATIHPGEALVLP